MAKKLQADERVPFVRWGTTRAEDFLIIDSYLKVLKFVAKADTNWIKLEENFFRLGNTISDQSIIHLNSHLKRKGFDQIILTEGHSDSYSLIRGTDKANEREKIKRQLEDLSEAEREVVMMQRRTEIMHQPERDIVYDARKAMRTNPFQLNQDGVKMATTKLGEHLSELTKRASTKKPVGKEASSTAAAPIIAATPAAPSAPAPTARAAALARQDATVSTPTPTASHVPAGNVRKALAAIGADADEMAALLGTAAAKPEPEKAVEKETAAPSIEEMEAMAAAKAARRRYNPAAFEKLQEETGKLTDDVLQLVEDVSQALNRTKAVEDTVDTLRADLEKAREAATAAREEADAGREELAQSRDEVAAMRKEIEGLKRLVVKLLEAA